jgi:hypothetical protein
MAWNKTNPNATKHTCNDGYGPAFGRKTPGCPRCDELLAGAEVRSWGGADKKVEYAKFLKHLRNHNCETSNCGPICTAFDN